MLETIRICILTVLPKFHNSPSHNLRIIRSLICSDLIRVSFSGANVAENWLHAKMSGKNRDQMCLALQHLFPNLVRLWRGWNVWHRRNWNHAKRKQSFSIISEKKPPNINTLKLLKLFLNCKYLNFIFILVQWRLHEIVKKVYPLQI